MGTLRNLVRAARVAGVLAATSALVTTAAVPVANAQRGYGYHYGYHPYPRGGGPYLHYGAPYPNYGRPWYYGHPYYYPYYRPWGWPSPYYYNPYYYGTPGPHVIIVP
jgi:hypothetical protein